MIFGINQILLSLSISLSKNLKDFFKVFIMADLKKQQLEVMELFPGIVHSTKMLSIFNYIESISKTDYSVLVTGETGVGKELMAKTIHASSQRKGKYVAVNLAGLDDQLFADTLFGHVKGAYTGADQNRMGLIEQAQEGTLFLDEIGDLNQPSQIKLLRLLQEGEYLPVGADDYKTSNARVILATHCDLIGMVKEKQFRKDLFFRVNAHHIHIPSLTECKDDIHTLLDFFLESASCQQEKTKPAYPPELITLLKSYHFPGNIREFKGMVFDAVIRHHSGVLSLESFKNRINIYLDNDNPAKSQNFNNSLEALDSLPTLEDADKAIIVEALRRSEGNQSLAADMLKMNRTTLVKRIQKYGI
jgi:transcriptional regulator with PAS, ATPase and Fis domain